MGVAKKSTVAKKAARQKTVGSVKSQSAQTSEAQTSGGQTKATKKTVKKPTSRKASRVSSSSVAILGPTNNWTPEELVAIKRDLMNDLERLGHELDDIQEHVADLIRDSTDQAGDDPADTGAKAFEREQEMVVAENARELILQNKKALRRIDEGTFGICEGCGEVIDKRRVHAFPRATLCLSCKRDYERR